MPLPRRLVLGSLLAALLAGGCASTSAAGLPMIPITIAGERIKAEVVATDAERARGLMYRRELADNRGMLFVYPTRQRLSFWMKNTFVPLTIAFIADDGTIVHLEDMAPQTLTSHKSPKSVRYALEMNKGWFRERGIEVGAKAVFELPENLEIK